MEAQTFALVDDFAAARRELEDALTWLGAQAMAGAAHATVEETLQTRGHEVLRLALQGFYDACARVDRRRAEALATRTDTPLAEATRPMESIFGRLIVHRYEVPATGDLPAYFPLDDQLQLPRELYSLPVRRRVAENVRAIAMGHTVETVDRTTGAHVPKRQVEQLAVRAAQDFDAFYAQRPQPANDARGPDTILVMSCDSAGVRVIPKALRPATREKAEAARATRPAHRDPMAPKPERKHDKRMALVTAVYAIEPNPRTPTEVLAGLSRTKDTAMQDGETQAPPRPQHKTVTATVVKSQKAGIKGMFDEGERRDPTHEQPVAVLVDGEKRQLAAIIHEGKARLWTLVIILDLLHVLHYVWAAAKVLHAEVTGGLESVMDVYLLMLLGGCSEPLAATLVALAKERNLRGTARKKVMTCVRYLRRNAAYLHYDAYLAAGFPIATGVIEGACRHLVRDRLDITGARWGLESAEAVLCLRALYTNGDWDAYWIFHQQQEAARNACKLAA